MHPKPIKTLLHPGYPGVAAGFLCACRIRAGGCEFGPMTVCENVLGAWGHYPYSLEECKKRLEKKKPS